MAYEINLDANPIFVAPGFEVIEHRVGGFLHFTPKKPQIELYLSPTQRKGVFSSTDLVEELKEFDGIQVNANALDYFIAHMQENPWIIPEEWKDVEQHASKYILFWGTRHLYEEGICVRTLEWSADARKLECQSRYGWIDNRLNSQFPAAIMRRPATTE